MTPLSSPNYDFLTTPCIRPGFEVFGCLRATQSASLEPTSRNNIPFVLYSVSYHKQRLHLNQILPYPRLHINDFLDLNFFVDGHCLCSNSFPTSVVFLTFQLFTVSLSPGAFLRQAPSVVVMVLFREGQRGFKDVD